MNRGKSGKRHKDPRISGEMERYYNNRTSGGWKAPGTTGPLPFPAGKDGQQQFRSLDMWGNGVPGFLRDVAQPHPEGAGDEASGLVSDTYQHKNALTVYEGGGLIQLKCPSLRDQLNLPPRGEITSFSSGAARRFRFRLAKVLNTAFEKSVLLTMTYPEELHEELKEWEFYKAHLKAYWMAFRREFPDASGFWKLEFQKNGRPHYHCVVFGLGFERSEEKLADFIKWHSSTWFRIVGSGLEKHLHAGTRAEFPKHTEAARNYISQYAAKQEQQCAGFTGRYWGQINKPKIPFAPAAESILTDRQAILSARVMRKIVEKQTNAKRWKAALKECGERGERGWSRVAFEYGRTLQGKAGEAVLLSSETWNGAIYYGDRLIKGTFTSSSLWHHFFPAGVGAGEILKGECRTVSDRMTPRFLKVPRKYRARRNHSASYLGDASALGSQLQRYLSTCDPQPEYLRMRTKSSAI